MLRPYNDHVLINNWFEDRALEEVKLGILDLNFNIKLTKIYKSKHFDLLFEGCSKRLSGKEKQRPTLKPTTRLRIRFRLTQQKRCSDDRERRWNSYRRYYNGEM